MSEKKDLSFDKKMEFLFQSKRYPAVWDTLRVSDERIKEMLRLCCRKLQAFPYIQESQWPTFMNGMYFQTKTSKEPLFFGPLPLSLAYLSGTLENLVVYTVDKLGNECGSTSVPVAAVVESFRRGAKRSNKTDLTVKKLEAERVKLVTQKDDVLPYRFLKSERKYNQDRSITWVPTKKSAWYTDPHQRFLTAATIRHLRHVFPDIFFGAEVRESADDAERPEVSADERARSWAGNNTGGVEIDTGQVSEAIERSKQKQREREQREPSDKQSLPPWPDTGQEQLLNEFDRQRAENSKQGQQSMDVDTEILDSF